LRAIESSQEETRRGRRRVVVDDRQKGGGLCAERTARGIAQGQIYLFIPFDVEVVGYWDSKRLAGFARCEAKCASGIGVIAPLIGLTVCNISLYEREVVDSSIFH